LPRSNRDTHPNTEPSPVLKNPIFAGASSSFCTRRNSTCRSDDPPLGVRSRDEGRIFSRRKCIVPNALQKDRYCAHSVRHHTDGDRIHFASRNRYFSFPRHPPPVPSP
jgi:hypothetical protein